MKIVMIGHTGAGKTSYMASMYREMSTAGVNGFWVRAQRDTDHRSLSSLAGAIAKSRYPKASDIRRTYDLTLRHSSSPLLDFVWSDYRGGVLRDSEGSQVGEFIEDVGSADAVLLFIQATDLISRRTAMRARIRDLTNIVFEAIDGREQAVPIVVVVTKADLVEFDDETLKPLQGFVDAARADMRVWATIVPTVCGPKPDNVVLPVMFALYFGLRARAERLLVAVNYFSEVAVKAEGRATFADFVKSKVKGEQTYGEIAAEMRYRAQHEFNALEPLLGPVDALGHMLSGGECVLTGTDAAHGVEDAPQIQVTMLGSQGSGKTTYLLGMYAEMAAGVEKYFMTSDQRTHVLLTRAWDALIEEGLLPKATPESQAYEFRFRYGMETLLALDWLDYRGGLITSTEDEDPAVADLLSRLAQTDSIYLTFDGALLASVLAEERKGERQLTRIVALYNNQLAFVSDRRREAGLVQPSVVLLVTKCDRLIEYLSGDAEERQRAVVAWVRGQFEQLIEPGRDVAVCTVSLGELGRDPEMVEPSVIDPVRVHKPMVFTLFAWYRRQAILFEATSGAVRARGQRELREFGATQAAGIRRFLGRKRANELAAASRRSDEEAALLSQLANECWARVHVLERELEDIYMFIDGEPAGVA